MLPLLSELISDYIKEEDSEASAEAKGKGLEYKGFGRWADPRSGQVTHKTQDGRLVPVDPSQGELPMDKGPAIEKQPEIPGAKRSQRARKGPGVVKGAPADRPEREKSFASQQGKAQAIKQVAQLAKNHDWDYEYSDDHSVWQKGKQSERAIIKGLADSSVSREEADSIFDRLNLGHKFGDKMWSQVERMRQSGGGPGREIPDPKYGQIQGLPGGDRPAAGGSADTPAGTLEKPGDEYDKDAEFDRYQGGAEKGLDIPSQGDEPTGADYDKAAEFDKYQSGAEKGLDLPSQGDAPQKDKLPKGPDTPSVVKFHDVGGPSGPRSKPGNIWKVPGMSKGPQIIGSKNHNGEVAHFSDPQDAATYATSTRDFSSFASVLTKPKVSGGAAPATDQFGGVPIKPESDKKGVSIPQNDGSYKAVNRNGEWRQFPDRESAQHFVTKSGTVSHAGAVGSQSGDEKKMDRQKKRGQTMDRIRQLMNKRYGGNNEE